ncbi:MAG: hypothetical protein JWR84_1631 [Caulobacter sp.]|nr:hypothetical protein [Caulobacter sp.]
MVKGRKDLTRTDWLLAGQAVLRDDGPRALKLRPLAATLGISTGSFYHHFADFEDYLGQLADYFSGEQLMSNLERVRTEATTPVRRILLISDLAFSQDLPRLSMAMRAWARGDARARASVKIVDDTLMAFFADCLEGMGHPPQMAMARAYLLVASATADIEPPAGLGAGLDLRDLMLEIIAGIED